MKLLLFTFLTEIFYMAYLFWGSANAQYYEDPNIYFQKFEFDMTNRGTFNISPCMTDFLNCLELVTGEVICSNHDKNPKIYTDPCSKARAFCHDYNEEYDNYYGPMFHMEEKFCTDNNQRT